MTCSKKCRTRRCSARKSRCRKGKSRRATRNLIFRTSTSPSGSERDERDEPGRGQTRQPDNRSRIWPANAVTVCRQPILSICRVRPRHSEFFPFAWFDLGPGTGTNSLSHTDAGRRKILTLRYDNEPWSWLSLPQNKISSAHPYLNDALCRFPGSIVIERRLAHLAHGLCEVESQVRWQLRVHIGNAIFDLPEH